MISGVPAGSCSIWNLSPGLLSPGLLSKVITHTRKHPAQREARAHDPPCCWSWTEMNENKTKNQNPINNYAEPCWSLSLLLIVALPLLRLLVKLLCIALENIFPSDHTDHHSKDPLLGFVHTQKGLWEEQMEVASGTVHLRTAQGEQLEEEHPGGLWSPLTLWRDTMACRPWGYGPNVRRTQF